MPRDQVIDLGYRPREQQEDLHRSMRRFAVVVAHRRFGKTVMCLAHTIDRALKNQRTAPRYAYIAPLYRQAKAVAWDYLKAMTREIPGTTVNEAELRVDLPNGARIQLFGADRPDTLRGMYLDGVILDEYAQQPPEAWTEVIRPALSDRQGWAIFIGTPKGRNRFCELYEGARDGSFGPEWSAHIYRASETGILPAAELESARQAMSADEYDQEYDCSFQAAIKGAYYGHEIAAAERDGRVTRVPYDPGLQAVTAWDLGYDDSTAIWIAQEAGREVRLIDYYEASNAGLEHYAGWLKERGYVFAEHVTPHDVGQHHISSGRSTKDTMHSLGIRPVRVIERTTNLEGDINATRRFLARCVFDAERCARGLECLRQYRREWDAVRQVFKPAPLHDWASDGADAFRTLAVGWRSHIGRPRKTYIADSNFGESEFG